MMSTEVAAEHEEARVYPQSFQDATTAVDKVIASTVGGSIVAVASKCVFESCV